MRGVVMTSMATGAAIVPKMRLHPAVARADAVWRTDGAWLRCLVDPCCLPGQGWWRAVAAASLVVVQQVFAGASGSAAGSEAVWASLGLALAVVAGALVIVVLLALQEWRLRRVGSGEGGRLARVSSPVAGAGVALVEVHAQLRRDFDASLRLLVGLPADARARQELPLLRDQVAIAAHGTERLLATVRHARAGEQVLRGCAVQAGRVAAAAASLHAALSAAARQPASSTGLAAAVDAVEAAVDELYVVVTGAFPPHDDSFEQYP